MESTNEWGVDSSSQNTAHLHYSGHTHTELSRRNRNWMRCLRIQRVGSTSYSASSAFIDSSTLDTPPNSPTLYQIILFDFLRMCAVGNCWILYSLRRFLSCYHYSYNDQIRWLHKLLFWQAYSGTLTRNTSKRRWMRKEIWRNEHLIACHWEDKRCIRSVIRSNKNHFR